MSARNRVFGQDGGQRKVAGDLDLVCLVLNLRRMVVIGCRKRVGEA